MKLSPLLLAMLYSMPLVAGEPLKIESPASAPPAPLPPVVNPADEANKIFPLGGKPTVTDPVPSLVPPGIPVPQKNPPVAAKTSAPKKPTSTLRPPETAVDLDQRIRYRKARSIAESDPKVLAAWDASRAAKTDYAKRQAMKHYYEVLYERMLAVDRGIAILIAERKAPKEASFDQIQIAPTVPRP